MKSKRAEDIERFMFELFDTARYISFNIHVHYSEYTGEWNIEGKSYDRNNVKVYNAYGTNRINGYKIIEETLNLRDVRIFDYVEDENGNKKPVLNKNDTAVAQGKQQLIKEAFAEWIWKDRERRERLTKLYNEKFNSVRPREYNGEHLNFVGMNPEITLRPHQVNAIAHILYGGNTLLAHVVGAGKTFEMVAAAQESKRLGLCNKSLFVVPNHLTEQWAAEYLQLYPSANILVASKNENPEVEIYTYVTENTFDSYLYQLVESKQKFIGQIMTSKSPVRSAEDVDEQALSYAEIKALCTGNPYIKEKMDLDIDVSRLKLLKANHLSQIYSLEDKVHKEFPAKIAALEERIKGFDRDIATANSHPAGDKDNFCGMTVKGVSFSEKKDAGEAIIAACKDMTSPDAIGFGSYRGFDMELSFDTFSKEYKITLIGELRHTVILGTDIFGNILRLDNAIGAFSERQIACKEQLDDTKVQLENAKAESQKPFPHEEELKTKSARLAELNTLLDMDKRDNELVDGERGDDAEEPDRSNSRDAR